MTSESQIQQSIVAYLKSVLPADIRVFHFHQNPRSKIEGAKLKRMGLTAGLADLGLIRAGGFIALIEIKTEKGRLSDSQKDLRDWCGANAVPYAVCRNIADVEAFCADLNIPLRGEVAA